MRSGKRGLREAERATLVAAAVAAVILASAAGRPAMAAPGSEINFVIPPQTLEASLLDLSRQAQVQLVMDGADVAGLRAPALSARMTPRQAVERLLRGTPLTAEWVGTSTVAIKPRWRPLRRIAFQSRAPEPAVPPEPPSADTTTTVDDIIVTARRREERLRDVPIAITAFSNTALEQRGVTRAGDLVNVTPSLKIAYSSQRRVTPSYELRAISSTECNIGQDCPVALYQNEVYLSRPYGTNSAFYDLENVQVLMGPQGTLFGRNAAAGAILFTSKKPTDGFEGEIQAGTGNYGTQQLTGVVNLPLGENVAIRLAGQRNYRHGFSYDITNNHPLDDVDDLSGRVSVRATFDRLENNLVADGYRSDTNGSANTAIAVRLASFPRAPGQAASSVAAAIGDPALIDWQARQAARGPRRIELPSGFLLLDEVRVWGFSNVTTFSINDDLTLKNVIGHRYARLKSRQSFGGMPFIVTLADNQEKSESWSEEFQLQGSALDSSLSYILGAYAFKETGLYNSISQQITANNFSSTRSLGRNQSYSIFAQGTYKIPPVPGLSLTAGARYTWDKREIRYVPITPYMLSLPGTVFVGAAPLSRPCSYTNLNSTPNLTCVAGPSEKTFKKPTWTVSLDYKPTPDVLLYAAHRRGYRAGGFNARATVGAEQITPFAPETVSDVEVGLKAAWRLSDDLRLVTDGAAYYTWYDNIQRTVQTTVIINGAPIGFTRIANAAKATVKGFELKADLYYRDMLTVSAYVGYADAVHKRFDTLVNGVPTTLRDQPFGSMKNSAGLTVTLTPVDDPETGTVNITANAAYSGSYYNTTSLNLTNPNLPFLDPTGRVPSRTIVNASIEWNNIDGSAVSAQAWVRNLTNKTYLNSTLALFNGATGVTTGLYGEPRMYGATVKYRFGER